MRAYEHLRQGDADALRARLANEEKQRQYVSYIFVYDAQGRPVAEAHDEGMPPDLLARLRTWAPRAEPVQVEETAAGRVVDIALPAGQEGDILGTVRYGFSDRGVSRPVNYVMISVFAATIGAIALSVVVGLLLANYIARPLLELKKAVVRIAGGDLEVGVDVAADDEIGDLAGAFNTMVANLRRVTASRDELDREIAERAKAEESLAAAYRQLVETQTRLIQAEKMASVGQLAAGVAHEINNPLSFVTSNLRMLEQYHEKLEVYAAFLQGAVPEGKRVEEDELARRLGIGPIREDMPSLMSQTQQGVERIRKIVSGLRSFAHTDSGAFEQVDLNLCMESALDLLMNELKYKADVVKEYGAGVTVEGAEHQLAQVFINLLMNAAQAIEKYGKITIRTRREKGDAVVEIADTGCGIPEEIRKKIFDPFFTTKPVGAGTGLGLSIAHGIVERHRGTIEVASEVGKGSTFVIRLPAGRG
ncbi:MAG TPA: ATP-binding protein [bacterium]|nr:ATP-binding protein [bacterium]